MALPTTYTDPDSLEQSSNAVLPTTKINAILGNLKLLGGTDGTPQIPRASASLANQDNTNVAGQYNQIGTGLSLSLAAGTWLVWGAVTCSAATTDGSRSARIYNVTDGATVSAGGGYAATQNYSSIAVAPAVVTLAGTKVLELQFWAKDTNDSTYGQAQGSAAPSTSIVAIRVA
jgi:hypothetical protein